MHFVSRAAIPTCGTLINFRQLLEILGQEPGLFSRKLQLLKSLTQARFFILQSVPPLETQQSRLRKLPISRSL